MYYYIGVSNLLSLIRTEESSKSNSKEDIAEINIIKIQHKFRYVSVGHRIYTILVGISQLKWNLE